MQVAAILDERLGEGQVRSLLGGVSVQSAAYVPAGAGADPDRLIARPTARDGPRKTSQQFLAALQRLDGARFRERPPTLESD